MNPQRQMRDGEWYIAGARTGLSAAVHMDYRSVPVATTTTMNDSRSEDLALTGKAQPNHDTSQVFLCCCVIDILVRGGSYSRTWGDVQPPLSTSRGPRRGRSTVSSKQYTASQYA